MAASASAARWSIFGSDLPKVWNQPVRRSTFGDIAIVLFLVAQCCDGVLTYVGVAAFGLGIEGNPLIASMMAAFGHGAALTGAKVVASILGICLHLCEIHTAVAALTCFYFAAAVVPWTSILFF